MLFQFGNAVADIDVETTRKFYHEHNFINNCRCSGCKNYRHWVKHAPAEIHEQLRQYGIDDMKTVHELMLPNTPSAFYQKTKKLQYMGWYHVVGEIIHLERPSGFDVTEDFSIGLTGRTELVHPDFPRPVLQIDLDANIPWIIGAPVDDFLM